MKFVILFALLAIAKCQYVQDGNCPDVHVLHNLDRDKVLGLWYTVRTNADIDFICPKDDLLDWNENVLNGRTYAYGDGIDYKYDVPFKATLKDESGAAKFAVEYSQVGMSEVTDIQVVDTDYDNYFISMSCKEDNGTSETTIWIDTRSKTPSAKLQEQIITILKQHNLDTTELRDISQKC